MGAVMIYGRKGLLAAALLVIGCLAGLSPALANDDDDPNTFWADRAKKAAAAKKTTTTTTTTTPAPATTPTRTTTTRRATSVRRAPVETAPSGLPPEGETRFVKDQVIVRYRLSARSSNMDALVGRLNLAHLDARTFRMAGVTVHLYQITDGSDVSEIITALEADGTVVSAQPNYIYTPAQDANAGSNQYALGRLGVAPDSGAARGSGVRLAIIDSVVDVAHPEFANAKIEAHDVSDAPDAVADAHGTGITGVAAAGNTLLGIAPEADIVAIAAFAKAEDGQTYGNSWTIATALDLAASENAQVVNMSFAGPRDPLLESSISGAGKRGMVLVAAAGNDGPDAAALYPAAYEGTIGVTAIDENDGVYVNANRGAYVELAAPGVNILTAAPDGAYDFISGTSLASAHVSALAALLLSADPSQTPEQIAELLMQTSNDLGEAGRDDVFGAGVPNAAAALGQLGN